MSEIESKPFPRRAWLAIWTKPCATMRAILDSNERRCVYRLAMLGGISDATMQGISQLVPALALFGEKYLSTILILGTLLALVGGAVSGLVYLLLGSLLILWTGKWLGGQATRRQIMAAMAWSEIPSIVMFLPMLCFVVYVCAINFGTQYEFLSTSVFAGLIIVFFVLTIVTLLIWKCVIFLKCLGEAQRFSFWLALANALIAWLIFVFVMMIPMGILAVVALPSIINMVH